LTTGFAGFADDLLDMGRQEIADANRTDQPAPARLDQRLPGFDIKPLRRIGPVYEIEIIVIELRAVERLLHRRDRLGETMMAAGQLGCHMQVGAGHAASRMASPAPLHSRN
jgi:hypothetical protein